MPSDGMQSEMWKADALRCMVRDGNRGAVQRLVRRGTSIFADAGRGRPLLSLAARHGHEDIVGFLIKQGADVNEKGSGSKTALHAAVKNGYTEIASTLIEHGADVKAAEDNGSTALHLAARLGLTETVRILIEKKADVNAHDDDLWTPLHEAARYGHFEVAIALIEAGAKVDAMRRDFFTPLHSAARYGHRRIALALIQHGANVNRVRIEQWTPLLSAVRNRHTELSKDLITRGANVNDKNYASCSALHLAAMHGHVGVVSTLIKNGADINATQDEGRTPLHLAASKNHADIVSLLVANGAKADVLDKIKGWTALDLAVSYGYVGPVMKLLKSGSQPNSNYHGGNTPLLLAVERNRLEVVDGMLKQGYAQNLSVHDETGNTPLHFACLTGSEEMVEKLLRAGANADATEDSGRTPLDFIKQERPALMDLFESALQRFKSGRSGSAGISVTHGDLQSGHTMSASARESTFQSSTDLLQSSMGYRTLTTTQGTSSSSFTSEIWSAEAPFGGSRESMLSRIKDLVRCRHIFDNQYKLQPGTVDDRQHICSIVDTYGGEELVVKFYYEETRFKNATRMYGKVAKSDFVGRALKRLKTSNTGQPSGIVLKRGSITLSDWQRGKQALVSRIRCLEHILKGVRELHLLDIVHTDLKSSKIMLFSGATWRVIGLDKARKAGREAVTAEATEYSAPELLGLSKDGASSLLAQPSLDMWSFGVIAYEVITGDKLFGDVDEASSIAAEIDSGRIQSKLEEIQIISLKEMLINVLKIDPAERWTVHDALRTVSCCDDASTTSSS